MLRMSLMMEKMNHLLGLRNLYLNGRTKIPPTLTWADKQNQNQSQSYLSGRPMSHLQYQPRNPQSQCSVTETSLRLLGYWL